MGRGALLVALVSLEQAALGLAFAVAIEAEVFDLVVTEFLVVSGV
jgi:hypothetical protein